MASPVSTRSLSARAGRSHSTIEAGAHCAIEDMDHFPRIPHQRAGGGIDCSGLVIVEGAEHEPMATLRCDECGAIAGTINRGILRDLVNLTVDLDLWQPTAEGCNGLAGLCAPTSMTSKRAPIPLGTSWTLSLHG